MKISFSVEFFVVVFFPEFVSWDCGGGSAVTLGGAPGGLWCPPLLHLCICITAPHYFSFPNINICVQISPLPASELLMGLWAPLKCILAARLLQDTLCSYLDAQAGVWYIANVIYGLYECISMSCMKRECGALKCILRMRGAENLSLVTTTLCWAEQIQRGPSTSIIWCSSGNSVLYP